MNSQEHNEGNTPTSQVDLLSIQFKLTLIRKQEEKIAALEAGNKELAAENAAWEDEMKSRCRKMKEMKKEIKSKKREILGLEKTRDDRRQVARDLDDHVQLLKADHKKYCEESAALAEEQREAVEEMERKWKTYEAGYETLPMAVVRNEEKTNLQMAKIQLMVSEHRLAEVKEIGRLRRAIEEKRRNNTAVRCAELYKEGKIGDIKMRVAIATRKRLEETLRLQEKTLAELEKKEKEQLAAPQELAEEESHQMPIFTPSQERLTPIPRFDLSFVQGTVTQQPISTLTKDLDTISITSSVIDNLMEPKNIQPTEANEYDRQQQAQAQADNSLDSNSKANDVEEDVGNAVRAQRNPEPCAASLRFKEMDDEEEAFDKFEAPVDEQQDREAEPIPPRASEEELGDTRKEDIVESEYWPAVPIREAAQVERIPAQNCPSEIKRPRISKTEKVQLKLTPQKTEGWKSTRDNSLATYFDASTTPSANYNWTTNRPTSFTSNSESQRENVELESDLVSEASMQSEDFMKQFRFSFSPERGETQAYMRPIIDEKTRNATPQATGAGPSSQIGARPQVPQGFLDFGAQGTPTSRGKKNDGFFLNLF